MLDDRSLLHNTFVSVTVPNLINDQPSAREFLRPLAAVDKMLCALFFFFLLQNVKIFFCNILATTLTLVNRDDGFDKARKSMHSVNDDSEMVTDYPVSYPSQVHRVWLWPGVEHLMNS